MFKKIVFLSWTALFAVFALNFTACGDDESFVAKPQDGEKSCSSLNGAGSSSSEAQVTGCETCEFGKLKDDRDGQTYRTVKIGDQWWMAENLNYAYLQPTETLDSSSFCYDNDPENCKQYGRLYLFSAAMDSVLLTTLSLKFTRVTAIRRVLWNPLSAGCVRRGGTCPLWMNL